MENIERMESILTDELLVDEEVVRVLEGINGRSVETLEDLLYFYTGYRSFDQLEEVE